MCVGTGAVLRGSVLEVAVLRARLRRRVLLGHVRVAGLQRDGTYIVIKHALKVTKKKLIKSTPSPKSAFPVARNYACTRVLSTHMTNALQSLQWNDRSEAARIARVHVNRHVKKIKVNYR